MKKKFTLLCFSALFSSLAQASVMTPITHPIVPPIGEEVTSARTAFYTSVGTTKASSSSSSPNGGGVEFASSSIGGGTSPLLDAYASVSQPTDAIGGLSYASATLAYYAMIVGPDGRIPVTINGWGRVVTAGNATDDYSYASLHINVPYDNAGNAQGVEWDIGGYFNPYNPSSMPTAFTTSETYEIATNTPIYVIMGAVAQVSANWNGSVETWVDPTFVIDPAYASSYAIVYSADLPTSTNVPEPGSIALLGLGLVGMSVSIRRKAR